MINKLKKIENSELLNLLKNQTNWETLDIDYAPPRVERLWMQYDDEHRLLIHKIHPCTKDEALFHPHPWKSAVHVLPFGGTYGHTVGTVNEDYEIYCTMEVDGEMYYEMLHIDGMHSVQPINGPIYSIMLIGKPIWKDVNSDDFNETLPVQPTGLKPLSNESKENMLRVVTRFFREKLDIWECRICDKKIRKYSDICFDCCEKEGHEVQVSEWHGNGSPDYVNCVKCGY